MIRDPSDGSVKSSKEINLESNEINAVGPKKLEEGIIVSGLPAGSTKPEELARLERSREFVRDYHAKKVSHRNTEGAKE